MSSKRRGLGRGLDALLGGVRSDAESSASTTADGGTPAASSPSSPAARQAPPPSTLAVDALAPNRYQPRSFFDDSGLDDLAESIRTQGVVQPIVVTPEKAGGAVAADAPQRYTIIAGERRWRAAQRAGLVEVPVVVREVTDDRQILEMALVENIQRADLNAIEESEAYRTLAETFDLSQEEIATRVGKGRTTITNALRLLRLPEEIQDFIREGRLTAGQARPLLAIPDRDLQIEIAERAIEEGLTARELEALVSAPKKPKADAKKKPEPDVHDRAAMEKLTRAFQTRVDIIRRKRGGALRIHFHSEDELIRLYDRLIEGDS